MAIFEPAFDSGYDSGSCVVRAIVSNCLGREGPGNPTGPTLASLLGLNGACVGQIWDPTAHNHLFANNLARFRRVQYFQAANAIHALQRYQTLGLFRTAMTAHSIPADLREFIAEHIHSIAQLEALLLLMNNERGFSLEECASRLYISPKDCEAALQPLIADRFVKADEGRFVLLTEDGSMIRKVRDLAEVYRRQLIPVTNLIHSKRDRIQSFADAFRVRKES